MMKGKRSERRSFGFPEEIITDILSRMPVKSLLRFNTVCKRWLVLIGSSNFVAAHLHSSRLKQPLSVILTFHQDYLELEYGISLLRDDAAPLTLDYHEMPVRFPLTPRINDMCVAGSSNGLVCISNSDDGTIFLWNPATRQHRLLPSPLFSQIHCEDIVALGFGFVHESNDYKLVRISQHFDGDDLWYKLRVEVFSLSSGSWREINEFPLCNLLAQNLNHHSVVVNGVWYRVVAELGGSEKEFVLTFDFRNEIFRRLEVPDYKGPSHKLGLLVYDDLLAISATPHSRQELSKIYDLWVLKNDSWTKILTIGPFVQDKLCLLGSWRSDNFIMHDYKYRDGDRKVVDHDLLLCDSSGHNFAAATKSRAQFFEQACDYVDSLVSVFPS